MYNIHSHYENIFSFIKTLVDEPVLLHFFPFGSIEYENIEYMHCNGSGRKDSPLFLCFDQEPIAEHLNSLIVKIQHDWGNGKRIILINTENNSLVKNQILSKYNIIDCAYFFHIFAAADWYRGYRFCADLVDPTARTIKKKFITFNRITGHSRAYRSLFIAYLQQQGLLPQGHISYSDNCPVHGDYGKNLTQLIKLHNVDPDVIARAVQSLNTVQFPLRIDNNELEFIPNGSQTIDALSQLMESFLCVVTETCFWESKQHLTEKIFKPIVTRHPFILLGCKDNLLYLKKYGFRTFDKWWDESYDQIEDPIQRMQAVVAVIKKISQLNCFQLENMLKDMKSTLDYNRELFYSSEFIDKAWQELQDNIKSATQQIQTVDAKHSYSKYIVNMINTDKGKYRYNPFNDDSWKQLQSNIASINASSLNF